MQMPTDYEKKGLIFNIQKFSIHDGSGMRTLIFMKGCPLSCIWCSNPESQDPRSQIMDIRKNCIRCGKCYDACPEHAISPEDFSIERHACTSCGACTKNCYAGAKKTAGRLYSVGELIDTIQKDSIIYRNSQGGVTVGGGEPIIQSGFVRELLKACREIHIHTALETCGYGLWDKAEGIFELADQIFFDLKHMDSREHEKLTGADNAPILQNAKKLAQMEKEIIFRLPLIQGLNDSEENLRQTGKFVAEMMRNSSRISIEILPYHNFGQDKYEWLSRNYALKSMKAPEQEHVEKCRGILKRTGCRVV